MTVGQHAREKRENVMEEDWKKSKEIGVTKKERTRKRGRQIKCVGEEESAISKKKKE